VSQDLLQIALEHHRAGRVSRAESLYQTLLHANPADADAMHWLGVLYFQSGQTDKAVGLLEKAAASRPEDPAFQHNLGQAYLTAGRKDEAIAAFDRSVAANPDAGEVWLSVAQARLSRGRGGDAEAAVQAVGKAIAAGLDTGAARHRLGIAFLAARQYRKAIGAFQDALAKLPNDASVLYHLALAQRGAGELKETRKCLIKALEIDPTLAQAWFGLGMLDAEAGKFNEAAGLFRRAIASKRDYAEAYQGLAKALQAAGKPDDANAALSQARRAAKGEFSDLQGARPAVPPSVAELERHLTLSESDAQAHFAMAALMNVFPPNQVPAETLSGLYDKYAPRFDEHLRDVLEYRLPEVLSAAISQCWNGKPMDILDLGCGTGLCGPLLRPMASTLAGVDLSAAMIAKARERGVYDRLDVGELGEFLRRSPRSFDLLICADVLIYLGDLSLTFEAAAQALKPGGLFAFSVEAGSGDRYELAPRSRRFMHSKPYLQRLAGMYGFAEVRFDTVAARQEAEKPVNGYMVILRLPE